MLDIINPYNEKAVFDYVSNTELKRLFSKPYPIYIENPRFGYIKLSKYFQLKKITIKTNKGKKDRSMVKIKNKYIEVKEEERTDAFICLCNFLLRFNRPHRDILFAIPKHPDVEPDEDLNVVNIYYKEPKFEIRFNKNGDMIRAFLSDNELYKRLLTYCFGPNYVSLSDTPELDFSYMCFRGFILQY